jgi:FdhD protein
VSPPPPLVRARNLAWRDGALSEGERAIAEECAVAFTYQRATQAVMMASPVDLEDFAVGFSITEGIVDGPGGIERLEVVALDGGIELRMDLAAAHLAALARRRRFIAGPSGCGLCGIDSLSEAMRAPPPVGAGPRLAPAALRAAIGAMPAAQALNIETRSVHAAGFWQPGHGLRVLREDVGRHNALDKLAGALARGGIDAASGVVLLTSRVSVEMVQKAAMMRAAVIVAVSAPTALAVRSAQAAGITLVAVARADGFEIFAHPSRILMDRSTHVA